MKLTILANTPSQKNGKMIVLNSRTGRRRVVSNKRVTQWHKDAKQQLQAQYEAQTTFPVHIIVTFYRDSLRRYDLDNAYSSVADALVHAGIVPDDGNKYIGRVTLIDGGIDRENARADILIENL